MFWSGRRAAVGALLFFLIVKFDLYATNGTRASLISAQRGFHRRRVSIDCNFLPVASTGDVTRRFVTPATDFKVCAHRGADCCNTLGVDCVCEVGHGVDLNMAKKVANGEKATDDLCRILSRGGGSSQHCLCVLPAFQ